MKAISIIFCLFCQSILLFSQNIGDFTSVQPGSQDPVLHIPSTHTFQYLIEHGDPITSGGTMPDNFDFTGYVPINGRSDTAYLSINSERAPGAVTVLDIDFNPAIKKWEVLASTAIDFSSVVGTAANCSGTVTPWGTVISCEEVSAAVDVNADGYYDLGWAVEINPQTKTLIDKRWALGNFKHENAVVHSNQRTVYQGADSNPGYLFKFVATTAQDLSSGLLYVYSGSKSGSGNWILLNNTTPVQRNTTVSQSAAANATVFNGIEDVEIGPDGKVYFAVKGENRVYRFQDSDPITGTTVTNFETYVGNTNYTIDYGTGTASVAWGTGNDNLAFDGDGHLWVLQDGGNNYIWVVKSGHTQAMPDVEIFGRIPAGSEPTGITFTPDYKYLFMSIQHPSSGNSVISQDDAFCSPKLFDKDVAIVIARNDDLGVTPLPCNGVLDLGPCAPQEGFGLPVPTFPDFSIYPNPAPQGKNVYLRVYAEQEEQVVIEVIDLLGKFHFQEIRTLTKGENTVELALDKGMKGMYWVRAGSGSFQEAGRLWVR